MPIQKFFSEKVACARYRGTHLLRKVATMAAQLLDTISELILTDPDESLLVTLSDGRTIELMGDGEVHVREAGSIRSVSL